MQYNHHRSHACTLLCTALALAFGCAAAHAADVKISGSVITGLYFNKVEGADNGNLKMGGAGELPDDPHLMLTAREDLGNGTRALSCRTGSIRIPVPSAPMGICLMPSLAFSSATIRLNFHSAVWLV